MGEYWKLANVTRREWIHPWDWDAGAKWSEWNYPDSRVMLAVAKYWPDHADTILAVSDYGNTCTLTAVKLHRRSEWPQYDNLDDEELGVLPAWPGWKRLTP